uniref:Uncharacterized protein n=1 Tax=Bacillus phage Adastra TaxID=3143958 RepID=A0AAU8BBI7_9CAUD
MKDFLSTENNNLGKTINEVRKEQGLDPIEGGEARLPSNAIVVFIKEDAFREAADGIFHIGVDMKPTLEDGDIVTITLKETGREQTGTVHLQPDGSFKFKAKEDK